MNILQIDVEPWYADLPIDRWDQYGDSVVTLTEELADVIESHGNRATFFILGEVAERHPGLVEELQARGHEIGSHGWWHTHLTKITEVKLREGIKKSLDCLSNAGITDIAGYRAPQFSLEHNSNWALPVLDEFGFDYDSSVFPVKTPLYGVPEAPLAPYRINYETLLHSDGDSLIEVPPTALDLPFRNLPIAGGFYLRTFPYAFLKRALQRVQKDRPCVCFLHPWEIDPETPRIDEYSWYRYHNLEGTRRKFQALNSDFEFGTTSEYLETCG